MEKATAISGEKLLRSIMSDNKIELYATYVSASLHWSIFNHLIGSLCILRTLVISRKKFLQYACGVGLFLGLSKCGPMTCPMKYAGPARPKNTSHINEKHLNDAHCYESF